MTRRIFWFWFWFFWVFWGFFWQLLQEHIVKTKEDDDVDFVNSRKRYYAIAHSIKEDIKEQPLLLKGGDLREYQVLNTPPFLAIVLLLLLCELRCSNVWSGFRSL